MTYNIKYDNAQDTINNWNDRKESMVKLVTFYHPDFLGLQEALHRQLAYLDAGLSDYAYIGVGRDDGKEKGEYSALLYNTDIFEVLEQHTIWLSETPEKVSVGWDASMERICTYGLFKHKESGKELWIFNTHFDHIGTMARERSAGLLLKTIATVNTANLPVILMGDLNLTPDTIPIQLLAKNLVDTKSVAPTFYGPLGTFNGFDERPLDHRIDYVFVKDLKVQMVIHIDDRMENNKHISDHLPVLAILNF